MNLYIIKKSMTDPCGHENSINEKPDYSVLWFSELWFRPEADVRSYIWDIELQSWELYGEKYYLNKSHFVCKTSLCKTKSIHKHRRIRNLGFKLYFSKIKSKAVVKCEFT